jgi:1-acyl-sn-glycerol-3-phosphate acyltransferase
LSQITDICLIPVDSSAGFGEGSFAVVVPDADELTARKVASARERVGELLVIAGCVLPPELRVTNFVLIEEELPRNSSGELDRLEIARRFPPRQNGPDPNSTLAVTSAAGQFFEHPSSQRFLRRLEEILEVKGPFSPTHDLETDLGMDSLTQVQVRIVLEEEFGVEIAHGELWRVRTVSNILTRVVAASRETQGPPTNTSWSHQLRLPPKGSLDQQFPLQRGLISWILFWCVTRFVGLLFRVFFQATIAGRDKLPKGGAMILAPNHLSYLDSPILFTLLPARLIGRTFFLAYREIFREPPLSRIVRSCRLILTGDAESLVESLRLCREGLVRDLAVCIFPEGIRSTSGTIMKARPGIGMLACEAQCPIVPILIEGSEKTLSPPHPAFRRCRVRLTVGDPIAPPSGRDFTIDDYQAMADRWREAVLRMQAQQDQKRF